MITELGRFAVIVKSSGFKMERRSCLEMLRAEKGICAFGWMLESEIGESRE